MKFTSETKEKIIAQLIDNLVSEKEIEKIFVFGSFINSDNPQDIDVAIYQNSDESYLSLALKYRKLTRKIAERLSLDIIPIKSNAANNSFLAEIESGELIYER